MPEPAPPQPPGDVTTGDVIAVDVDEALARRLIGSQCPEVDLRSLRLFGEGFDNICWLAGESSLFRFPRRSVAVPGVLREIALLSGLAGLLPLPVPAPSFVGAPDPAAGYPWPFYAAPLLAGSPCERAGLDDQARAALGGPLGQFLRALHSEEVATGAAARLSLPIDPNARADMGQRVSRTRAALGDVQRRGLWRPNTFVVDLLVSARSLAVPDERCVVHGDLHFRHLLVDGTFGPGAVAGRRALSGIIDWGDACLGSPSIDLQLLWSLLPPAGRRDFVDAYGPIGEDNLLRARILAFSLNAVLAIYGHTSGQPEVEREAVASLARAAIG